MPHALLTFFLAAFISLSACAVLTSDAAVSPHPLERYENGVELLDSYRGQRPHLIKAEKIFQDLIDQHPASPFGYLGMSQVKVIQAYRSGQRYDIRAISQEAMPMALKAMKTGPTVRAVHHNYDRFEHIFRENDDRQDKVRRLLFLFPERADTYFQLGDFLLDQGDSGKAIEYYSVALRFSESDEVRVRMIKRIARTFLTERRDPQNAIEFYQAALEIDPVIPSLWEDLGQAYFEVGDYEKSLMYDEMAYRLNRASLLAARIAISKSMILEKNGETDGAIALIQKELANNQDSALHRYLGNLYYKKGYFEQAFTHLQRAIRDGIEDTLVYYDAGRAAQSSGEPEKAREYYSQYLLFRGDSQEAEWIRENIPGLSHR